MVRPRAQPGGLRSSKNSADERGFPEFPGGFPGVSRGFPGVSRGMFSSVAELTILMFGFQDEGL